VSGDGSEELKHKTNMVFLIIEQWLDVNKPKMNAEKTKYMMVRSIRKEQRGEVILRCANGTQIEKVEMIKYLNIIIDDWLRFKDHCEYMLKKIGKKINFLKNKSISTYTRCLMYKSIIALHFEYHATLIMNMSETQLSTVQKTQNRATRVTLHRDKYIKINHVL